jgi:hypothetical protein
VTIQEIELKWRKSLVEGSETYSLKTACDNLKRIIGTKKANKDFAELIIAYISSKGFMGIKIEKEETGMVLVHCSN